MCGQEKQNEAHQFLKKKMNEKHFCSIFVKCKFEQKQKLKKKLSCGN